MRPQYFGKTVTPHFGHDLSILKCRYIPAERLSVDAAEIAGIDHVFMTNREASIVVIGSAIHSCILVLREDNYDESTKG